MSELMVVIQNSLDSVDKLKRLKIEDSQLTNSKEKVLLNYENRSIQLEETEIVLTVLEFRLIDALFKKKDSVITYDTLANILWKNAKDMPDNVRVYRLSNIIFHLRNKISTFEDQIKIRTIRSRGYKLEWNS
ncbi:helix-turn-helix domain-containing protein [Enterococcus termitis]